MENTKFSKQREALLEILKNTKSHPNADWIYEKARAEIPNISLGTVYRNLSKLTEQKIIKKIDVGDKREHYDADISPHSHLICEKCGSITDIFDDLGTVICKSAGILSGAIIKDYSLVLYGICKDCAEKNCESEK